jgi:hypothetical protein
MKPILSRIGTLVLLVAGSMGAQTYQGRILGTVRDSSSGVIVGAKVEVKNIAKGVSRDLITNGAGEYVASALEPGLYEVAAESPGFKKTVSDRVRLEVAQDRRIDLQLEPGEISQSVTVREVPIVDTATTILGGTLNNKEINDLPVLGRDFQNLVMLRPGIDRTPGGGGFSITSNGNRPEDNNYLVDGTDDNDAYRAQMVINQEGVSGTPATHLPLDAIQEFSTEEHPTAEYGWKPGAVVNIGLKSGTNDFHGTAYYFHRNSAFDARNFFDPVGQPISALRLHQFGASAGGPILHDKLFIFGAYEGVRNVVGNPGIIASPATVSIGDPTTSIPDAIALCKATPGCTPNPLSVHLAQLFPANNGKNPNGPNQIFQDLTNASREDNFVIKSDYHLSQHHTLTGRYFFGDSVQTEESLFLLLPQWLSQAQTRAQVVGFAWTWTPSSSWVNEARFGSNRLRQEFNPVDHNMNPLKYGINTGVTDPARFGLPAISVGAFAQLGGDGSFPIFRNPVQTYQISDNVSYAVGRHTIRFGGEFRRGSTNDRRDNDGRGNVLFPTLADFIDSGSVDSTGNLVCQGVPACGPQQGSIFVGDSRRNVSQDAFGLYAQDDWRVTSHFTVNGGLRYQFATVVKDSRNLLGNFDPSLGFVQVRKQISSPYNVDHLNFSPRLGFAWDIFGNSKTVLRAGSGMIHTIPHISAFIGQLGGGGTGLATIPTGAAGVLPGGGTISATDVTLLGTQLNWNPPPAQVFPVLNVPLDCSVAPCGITGVDKNLKTPYSIFWNLNVERAIGNVSSLEVAYVANKGVHLYSRLDLNQPDPASALSCFKTTQKGKAACEQLARPFNSKFPFLGQATILGNAEDSVYHSLQVTYTVRDWKGLNIVAGYTYGHALDDASYNRAFFVENSHDIRGERGNSDFDLRHRFTLALTYPLPSRSRFAHLLEGWQVSSIVIVESGLPFDMNDSFDDISFTGEFNDRWNIFGNYNDVHWTSMPAPVSPRACNPAVELCFSDHTTFADNNGVPTSGNPKCIAHANITQLKSFGCYQEHDTVLVPPNPGTFGNIERNAFRGPDFTNWDFSVTKNTKLTERLTLQLRGEFFNILNHPNFGAVDRGMADGVSVGRVVNTPDVSASNPVMGSGGSRHIQVGAKFVW